MINERAKYTAVTGTGVVSTANSNRNGTGATSTVISGGGNGTIINSITINARQTTSKGMIRIFLYDGDYVWPLIEIPVDATVLSTIDPGFFVIVNVNYHLNSSDSILASTEKGETFNIEAHGLQWSY